MMEQKRFDWLVENTSAVLAFANDETEHKWRVRLCDGRVLARLDCDDFDKDMIEAIGFDVEHADMDAVDGLYWKIISDVVAVLGNAMYRRELSKYGFLCESADQRDEALLELLSFFGVSWSEFVGDVFYAFGLYVDVLNEADYLDSDDDDDRAEIIDAVFESESYADILINYGSGAASYWQVAIFDGDVYYRAFLMIDDGDEASSICDQYGSFDEHDAVALECLRDAIAADIEGIECTIDYDPALFDLLDIEVVEEE